VKIRLGKIEFFRAKKGSVSSADKLKVEVDLRLFDFSFECLPLCPLKLFEPVHSGPPDGILYDFHFW